MRVIVIGCGIGGLSAPIALRKVGVDVALRERAPAPGEVGAGISLWANAIRALDYLGVGDDVRAVAMPLAHSELRTAGGRRLLLSYQPEAIEREIGVRQFCALAHRADLVRVLASHLPAEVAHYGRTCVRVEPRGDKVRVEFEDGSGDEADAVVGADGIRSAVRASVFGPDRPRYSGYTCWRGVCPRPDGIGPGHVAEWWGSGPRFGMATLPGGRVYWYATATAPAGGRSPAGEKEAVAGLFEGWLEPVPALVAATPPAAVLRNDIFDRPPTAAWSRGRVVLVGDAAHATTPNLGQGGCQAIEDAVVLARAVAGHPGNGLHAVHRRAGRPHVGHHQRVVEVRQGRPLQEPARLLAARPPARVPAAEDRPRADHQARVVRRRPSAGGNQLAVRTDLLLP